jgi:hypothetical protein
MRRKAIARHDVEAKAGQKRYPSRLGFGIPHGQDLEDVNFPGDVEVVNTIAKTRVRHRPRRRGERTGDAECAGRMRRMGRCFLTSIWRLEFRNRILCRRCAIW